MSKSKINRLLAGPKAKPIEPVTKSSAEGKPVARIEGPREEEHCRRPLSRQPADPVTQTSRAAVRHLYLEKCDEPDVDIEAEIEIVTHALRAIIARRGQLEINREPNGPVSDDELDAIPVGCERRPSRINRAVTATKELGGRGAGTK